MVMVCLHCIRCGARTHPEDVLCNHCRQLDPLCPKCHQPGGYCICPPQSMSDLDIMRKNEENEG